MYMFQICKCFIAGEGGVGKTTAMKRLALLWATSEKYCIEEPFQTQQIDKFDFLFYIPLKKIKSDTSLEQIIINEHCELRKKVDSGHLSVNEIAAILNDDKVVKMIIFDGLDEYKMGINSSVDAAIKHSIGNAFLALTTRPEKRMRLIQKYMDAEVMINGFSEVSVKNFVLKFFKDSKIANQMLSTSGKSGISTYSNSARDVLLDLQSRVETSKKEN